MEKRYHSIQPEPDNLDSPLHPTYQIDRPHIIYCEKTGKYVAWLKIMAGETSQFFTVLAADEFTGPYTIVHKMYKPLAMDTGDFALHVDETTKKGYIFFERPHFQLICATLTEDYTGVVGKIDGKADPIRQCPPFQGLRAGYFAKGVASAIREDLYLQRGNTEVPFCVAAD